MAVAKGCTPLLSMCLQESIMGGDLHGISVRASVCVLFSHST